MYQDQLGLTVLQPNFYQVAGQSNNNASVEIGSNGVVAVASTLCAPCSSLSYLIEISEQSSTSNGVNCSGFQSAAKNLFKGPGNTGNLVEQGDSIFQDFNFNNPISPGYYALPTQSMAIPAGRSIWLVGNNGIVDQEISECL